MFSQTQAEQKCQENLRWAQNFAPFLKDNVSTARSQHAK